MLADVNIIGPVIRKQPLKHTKRDKEQARKIRRVEPRRRSGGIGADKKPGRDTGRGKLDHYA